MGKRSLPVSRDGETRANEFAHGTRRDLPIRSKH